MDLALSDFFLLGALKIHLGGLKFDSPDEIISCIEKNLMASQLILQKQFLQMEKKD